MSPADLLRTATLATSTALGMAAEDPALLLVQAARRSPARLRRILAGALRWGHGTSPRRALGLWLAGHDGDARLLLADLQAQGRLGGLLAEVAVLLDVPGAGACGGPGTRARELWRAGAVSVAVATATGTRLGERLASEAAAMTVGRELPHRLRNASRATNSGPDHSPTAADRRTGAAPSGITVLHVLTNSLPDTTSGYAIRSHQVLLAQRAAGLRVAAATRVGYPVLIGRLARRMSQVDGVAYHRLVPWRLGRTPGARLMQQLDLLRPLVAQQRPDVLHTTTNYANALVTRALARELGVPWVYEVRGLLEDTWVASFPPQQQAAARASQRYAMLRAREAELAATADRVVVLGETVAANLVARGVDPARVVLAPNAVDAALLGQQVPSNQARSRLGLPEAGFWVGTVSSLVDYEGIGTLIAAVTELRTRGMDVRACVVGDGVARPALLQQVAEGGLGEHVLLPGRVPTAEAADWYRALDAFVVPRRDSEVTRTVVPLKPMQAMALGVPVVASDLPALREITGGDALFSQPDSVTSLAAAIERLAADDALRAQLVAAGMARAADRTWDAVGTTYARMYRELLAGEAA